jgi:dTDP-4-amino-4,6-dideoxygalactose transaminase
MKIPLMDVQTQQKPIRAELHRAVRRVLDSCHFVLGEEGRAFEAEFARLQGARHSLGVSSGTHALHLALAALGVGPGMEVVTTPFSFIASASSISYTGAVPVFADIDPVTLNLDPNEVERRLTPRTKAILVVHIFGYPADLDALKDIARRRNLALIEDCAQAHLTEYKGRKVGSLGDVGAFSFYPSKNLGAAGDAGAVTTDRDDLNERMRSLRDHGRAPDKRYEYEREGFNYRLDELQAAVLRVKMKRLPAWTAKRRSLAELYRKLLKDLPVTLPPRDKDGNKHTYHLFVIQTEQRDALARHLAERGIASGVYYPFPLPYQPAYRPLGYRQGDFPKAEAAGARGLALPLFAELGPARVRTVVREIARFFQRK